MKIKDGVQLVGMQPQILLAIMVADNIWKNWHQELVITSVTDGVHGPGSFHYRGSAVDFRIRYFEELSTKKAVHKELVAALGLEFDVVLHDTHIHVEWDPS